MPNINFPSNPTASQTYTFNGATWTFNGVAWSTSQPGFGPQGFQGFQGTTGPQGFQGFQGSTGSQGFQGRTGPTGSTGFQGTTGPQGFQGTTGPAGTGGGSVAIPLNQIVFGAGSGVTSSALNTFCSGGVILGSCCGQLTGPGSLILGGQCVTTTTPPAYTTFTGTSSSNSIIGGCNNFVSGGRYFSCTYLCTTYGPYVPPPALPNIYQTYYYFFCNYSNTIDSSVSSSILGGISNCIKSSYYTSIIGGRSNFITYTGNGGAIKSKSSIINGGSYNLICDATKSVILGGNDNSITTISNQSSIIGSQNSSITENSLKSSIIGGLANKIQTCSCNSAIIAGQSNTLSATSLFSAIIGGAGLSFSNVCNTVIVPTLILASPSTTRPHINFVAGASPSTPTNGDMWYDGTNFWIRSGSQSSKLPGSTASATTTNNAASNLFLFYNY